VSHLPRAAVLGALLGAVVGAVVLLIAAPVFGTGQSSRGAWAASVIGVLAAAGCALGFRYHWRSEAAAVVEAVQGGSARPTPVRATVRGAVRGLGWGGLVASALVLVPEAVGRSGADGLDSEGFTDALFAMVPTFAVVGALTGAALGLIRAVARD